MSVPPGRTLTETEFFCFPRISRFVLFKMQESINVVVSCLYVSHDLLETSLVFAYTCTMMLFFVRHSESIKDTSTV